MAAPGVAVEAGVVAREVVAEVAGQILVVVEEAVVEDNVAGAQVVEMVVAEVPGGRKMPSVETPVAGRTPAWTGWEDFQVLIL